MFAALLGPALSFGSSLLSGLGARQSAKKQAKIQAAYEYQNYVLQEQDNARNTALTQWRNEQNYMLGGEVLARWDRNKLLQDADRMGFNPVTYANAFGSSYAAMEQFGTQLRSPEVLLTNSYMQNAPTAQVPSVTEAFGGALQAGVNTYLSDRRVAQSQDFQREMLATQIAAISRNGGRPTSGAGVPASQRTFFGSGQIPYAVAASQGQRVQKVPPLAAGTWDPNNEKTDYVNPFGGLTTPGGRVIGTGTGYNRFPSVQAVSGLTGDEGPLPVIYGGFNTANYAWWSWFGRDIDSSLWVAGREAARSRALSNGGYDQYGDRGFHRYGHSTGGQF